MRRRRRDASAKSRARRRTYVFLFEKRLRRPVLALRVPSPAVMAMPPPAGGGPAEDDSDVARKQAPSSDAFDLVEHKNRLRASARPPRWRAAASVKRPAPESAF